MWWEVILVFVVIIEFFFNSEHYTHIQRFIALWIKEK